MDQKQAEQLAERIRNEVPNVIATVKQVTWVAGGTWAVAVAPSERLLHLLRSGPASLLRD